MDKVIPIGTKVKVDDFQQSELNGLVGYVSGHAYKNSFYVESDDPSPDLTFLHIVRCESGFGSFLMHAHSLTVIEEAV